MRLKDLFKNTLIALCSLYPRKKQDAIYTPYWGKGNQKGPDRFRFNLESGLIRRGKSLERFFLSGCSSAPIMSNSPGKMFFALCRRAQLKTVLRVDGFYLPEANPSSSPAHVFNQEHARINERMQNDLISSDWILYQSRFCKEMTDKHLYNRKDRYSIIYNGVDVDHFSPTERSPNENPEVLMLGTWRDPVLVIFQLNVFRELLLHRNCRLRICGTMTSGVGATVKTWMEKSPEAAKRITLYGAVSYADLPETIRFSDVAIQSKSGDWCPNSVLELMACGIPVVCSSWGGTRELVADGGIVVPQAPFDYGSEYQTACVKAILDILENREEFSLRARTRMVNQFSLDRMIDDYLKVLDSGRSE